MSHPLDLSYMGIYTISTNNLGKSAARRFRTRGVYMSHTPACR